MKKSKALSVLLILTMLICSLGLSASADQGIKVFLNGDELEFDVAPQIIDDRTMVPMRAIFEALGADVYWLDDDVQGKTDMLLAVKDDVKILMTLGYEYMARYIGYDAGELWSARYFGGAEYILLDVPPQLVSGRTLVPLRAVSEAFGVDVDWLAQKAAVILTCDEAFAENFNADKNFYDELVKFIEDSIIVGYNDILVYEADYTKEYEATLNAMFENEWTVVSVDERFAKNDGYLCDCGYDGRSQQFIEWTIEYSDGNGDVKTFVMSNRSTLAAQIEYYIESYIAEYYKENFFDVYLKDVPLAQSSFVFCFFTRLSSYSNYEEVRELDKTTKAYLARLETPEGTICLSKLTSANVFEMCPVYLPISVSLSGGSYGQSFEEEVMAKIEEMIEAMNEFANNSLNAKISLGYSGLAELHSGPDSQRWYIIKGERVSSFEDGDIFDSYKGVFW